MTLCSEIELLISLSLDEDLSQEASLLLVEHLAICEDCRSLHQELSRLHGDFKDLSAVVPESLHQGIMARISQGEGVTALPSTPKKKKLLYPFATAAALLLVITGAALSGQLSATKDGATAAGSVSGAEDPAALSIQADSGGGNAAQDASSEEYAALFTTEDDVNQDAGSTLCGDLTQNQAERGTLPGLVDEASEANGLVSKSDDGAAINGIADNAPYPAPSPAAPPMAYCYEPGAPPQDTMIAYAERDEDGLNLEEAQALLMALLEANGGASEAPVFEGSSADGSTYLFLVTDSQGCTWRYQVSLTTGSITGCIVSEIYPTPPLQ